jgi:integrase
LTADWQEANKRLRERLQARDDNLLEVVRKGETLAFGQWADFFLENYSKPPVRAAKTHEANERCTKHLKAAFGESRLVDITADSIDLYLRERLRQQVRIKAKLVYKQLGALKATTIHQEFRVLRRMLNVAVHKKLLAPQYLRNVIRIITETGLRIYSYKELTSMRKDQVDLQNAVVWIPDSKTPNGIAEVPLTSLAIEAFKSQMAIPGEGPFLFPNDRNPGGHLGSLKTVWRKTLRRATVPYFRIYDLRSTYATRLSAGGVADEWVTQMLRQGDAQVFKKYSQMKLQMKREALGKLNRRANEEAPVTADALMTAPMCTVSLQ